MFRFRQNIFFPILGFSRFWNLVGKTNSWLHYAYVIWLCCKEDETTGGRVIVRGRAGENVNFGILAFVAKQMQTIHISTKLEPEPKNGRDIFYEDMYEVSWLVLDETAEPRKGKAQYTWPPN